MWDLDELKDKVSTILVTKYDFTLDDASDAVDESVAAKSDLWNHNSDPKDLAKVLADDEDEE